jgi:hypothetical protein
MGDQGGAATLTMSMTDIFSKLAARDAAPRPPVMKTVRLWQVSLGNGRITKRLYPKARARKLAARYNRLMGGDRAYVAGPLKVRLQAA